MSACAVPPSRLAFSGSRCLNSISTEIWAPSIGATPDFTGRNVRSNFLTSRFRGISLLSYLVGFGFALALSGLIYWRRVALTDLHNHRDIEDVRVSPKIDSLRKPDRCILGSIGYSSDVAVDWNFRLSFNVEWQLA